MKRGNGLVALALSVLCACSDGRAGTLPTPSPSVTGRLTSPTTTASSKPALAPYARAYYDTLARVAANPADADALDVLIHPQCECRQVIDLLDDLAKQKHRLLFSVRLSETRETQNGPERGTVFVDVNQSAGKEVDSADRVVRSVPATSGTYAVDLVRSNDRWLVRQITKTS